MTIGVLSTWTECLIQPAHDRSIHNYAKFADVAIGVGMLVIGILSIQMGLLPPHVQWACIGAGGLFTLMLVSNVVAGLKQRYAPRCWLN